MVEQTSVHDSASERVGVVVIHGVGETDAGWINRHLVPQLVEREPRLSVEAHSEVYELPDRGRSDPDATFNAYLRRARIEGGPKVAFLECFWADLSRVGTGPITGFVSMLRLFYEAPQVLSKSALLRSDKGIPFLIKSLILFANWLLRWPITGTVVAAFLCALAVLGLQKLEGVEALFGVESIIPYFVGTVLLLLAAPAFWLGRVLKNRDIALSDIATSTAYSSLLLFALVVLGAWFYPKAAEHFDSYLNAFAQLTLVFWFFWSHAVLAAILLLLAIVIVRLFWREGSRLVAVNRPAAALALTTMQGVIWKIVVALPWLLLISALSPDSFDPAQCVKQQFTNTCLLQDFNKDLINVILFNIAMALALALGFVVVIILRALTRKIRSQPKQLPRLVISPTIIIVMFGLTLFNTYSFYARFYETLFNKYLGIPLDLPFEPYKIITEKVLSVQEVTAALTFLGGATAAIFLFFRIIRAAQNASRGLMHIARDLVDHQYSPEFAAARLFRSYTPQAQNIPPPRTDAAQPIDNPPPGIEYPRRNRIETRLDTLMQDVVSKQGYDRLVFVAHSQGTVILYDYLFSKRDEKSIAGVRRLDIVTLASPLSHLYRHYFHHYDQTIPPARLNENLASWINFWRIDDPIGHLVDTIEGDFVHNERLPRGGHLDYWKEDSVRDAILAFIDPLRSAGAPGPVHI